MTPTRRIHLMAMGPARPLRELQVMLHFGDEGSCIRCLGPSSIPRHATGWLAPRLGLESVYHLWYQTSLEGCLDGQDLRRGAGILNPRKMEAEADSSLGLRPDLEGGGAPVPIQARRLLLHLLTLGPDDPGYPGDRWRTKLQILHHLAQGLTEKQVARTIGCTRQNVNYHSREFRKVGTLKSLPGHLKFYKPGPEFACAVGSLGRHHGGWSNLSDTAPVVRVHNLGDVFTVQTSGGTQLPKPVKEWKAGGGRTEHAVYQIELPGGERAKVQLNRGPSTESVTIYVPDVYAAGTEGLEAVEGVVCDVRQKILNILEARHGVVVESHNRASSPEFAFPSPSLDDMVGFGQPGVGFVDQSKGCPEAEMRNLGRAAMEMERRERISLGKVGGFSLADDIVSPSG